MRVCGGKPLPIERRLPRRGQTDQNHTLGRHLNIEDSPTFRSWLTKLNARHLTDLRLAEVTRALRALSSAYVERRETAVRGALDSAGKRAAFALFYGPLHFLVTNLIVRALDAHIPAPRLIL